MLREQPQCVSSVRPLHIVVGVAADLASCNCTPDGHMQHPRCVCPLVCSGIPTTPPAPRRLTSTGASLSQCSHSQQQQRQCQVRVIALMCKLHIFSELLLRHGVFVQSSSQCAGGLCAAGGAQLVVAWLAFAESCCCCVYSCRWPVSSMQYSHSSTVGCSMGRQGGPIWPCCCSARNSI